MSSSRLRQAIQFYAVTMTLALGVRLTVPWTGDRSLVLTMLTPAFATLIMLAWLAPEGGWRDAILRLGLARLGLKGWAPALIGPVIIFGLSAAILAGTGVVTLVPPTMSRLASDMFLGLVAALGVGTLLALAEETGWRGYLLPRLMGLGPVRTMLLTGLLHGLWHLPLLLTTPYYHAEGNPVLTVPLFLVTLTLAGVFYGWLRLWTGSIWAVALAHAAVNLSWDVSSEFMHDASVLATEYLGGESGVLMIGGLAIIDIMIVCWSPLSRSPTTVFDRPLRPQA